MLDLRPEAEEVAQQVLAGAGQDALGVELHALERPLAVAQAHHDAVVRPGRHLEAVGHALRGRRPASGSASR